MSLFSSQAMWLANGLTYILIGAQFVRLGPWQPSLALHISQKWCFFWEVPGKSNSAIDLAGFVSAGKNGGLPDRTPTYIRHTEVSDDANMHVTPPVNGNTRTYIIHSKDAHAHVYIFSLSLFYGSALCTWLMCALEYTKTNACTRSCLTWAGNLAQVLGNCVALPLNHTLVHNSKTRTR